MTAVCNKPDSDRVSFNEQLLPEKEDLQRIADKVDSLRIRINNPQEQVRNQLSKHPDILKSLREIEKQNQKLQEGSSKNQARDIQKLEKEIDMLDQEAVVKLYETSVIEVIVYPKTNKNSDEWVFCIIQ